MTEAPRAQELPGLLRAVVLFHEAEILGAGQSVLQVVDRLGEYGWSVSGWIPGEGPLVDLARQRLAAVYSDASPIAFSLRGWQDGPGVLTRLHRTPEYLGAVRAGLLRMRPHVVHANTLLSLPEACVARRWGLPLVLQVHELPPPGAKRAAALRLACAVADVLVGVSDAVSAMLRRYARRTPVLTVHNGVAGERRPGRAASRPFTVGSIGTVSRLKGTDVFLHASALVRRARPDIRFAHAGQRDLHRDAGFDDELAGLLAEEDLVGRMEMLGRRSAAEVLPAWDIFVLPSRMEAFPLATLEAMAAGLPVIASDVGGVPEQIEHLVSGILVPPGDPDILADWIVRLHDDPGLRRRLGAEGARRARERFTLERQAAGIHRAYLLALNRRFGPPLVRRGAREAR